MTAPSPSPHSPRHLNESTFLREGLENWLETGALLSEPGHAQLWVGWGPLRRAAFSERPLPDGYFLTPDFFLREKDAVWAFERFSQVRPEALRAALEAHLGGREPVKPQWREAQPEEFRPAFDELFRRFAAGELLKAVPVVFDRAPELPPRPEGLAARLGSALQYAAESPVYLYGAWDGARNGGEGLLGATPEILVRREGPRTWFTAALAGTRRSCDRASLPPLLEDPKERREHQLVIDGIGRTLSGYGRVTFAPTAELQLPSLSHLKTPVTLHADREIELLELVRALHPTPALGAFPREAGAEIMQLLDRLSPLRRHRFGAPFGFRAPGAQSRELAVVAIRCLQWDGAELRAGAGCGVIAESRFEQEWLELRAKLASVRRIFNV